MCFRSDRRGAPKWCAEGASHIETSAATTIKLAVAILPVVLVIMVDRGVQLSAGAIQAAHQVVEIKRRGGYVPGNRDGRRGGGFHQVHE